MEKIFDERLATIHSPRFHTVKLNNLMLTLYPFSIRVNSIQKITLYHYKDLSIYNHGFIHNYISILTLNLPFKKLLKR